MKTSNHTHFSLSALAGLALAVTSANAATLLVDIGRLDQQLTQTGWEGWHIGSTGGSSFPTFTYADATGGSLNASITGGNTSRNYGLDNVADPGNLTNPDMWSDQYFFSGNVNGSITLTLGNLLAGDYQFTSYHYADDLSNDAARISEGVVDVSINTGSGFVDTGKNVTFTSGFTATAPGFAPTTRNLSATQVMTDGTVTTTFTVATDGDAVSILYNGLAGNGGHTAFGINGFEVSAIPEPSAAALLGLSALALLRRRRK